MTQIPDILRAMAEAIWNWETEGRKGEILDIEWQLLSGDYQERAEASLHALVEMMPRGVGTWADARQEGHLEREELIDDLQQWHEQNTTREG